MKLNELKHNHSLTDLLKILLFAILMLAPVGMVASRCLYVIANKNAYQSYSDTNVQKIEQINNAQSYVESFTYNVKPLTTAHTTSTAQYWTTIDIENLNTNAIYFKIFDNRTGTYQIKFYDNTDTQVDYRVWGNPNETLNTLTEFNFTLSQGTNLFDYANVYLIYTTTNKLDNVFEYSISQLEQSNLFNWTKNTAIYSGVETMTTQLGITNQTIPILLVYWFLLTVIYVIIDIILKLFTYMTHALSSRKA